MSEQLPALSNIDLDNERIARIKQNVLAAMLNNPTLLTNYAGHIIDEQNQYLLMPAITSSQQLSALIHQLISLLNQSEHYFKPKKYNFLQRWLGEDLEQQASSLESLQHIEQLTQNATALGQRMITEISQSQQQMQKLYALRVEMAHYIRAAEQFNYDCAGLSETTQTADLFKERLDKKINTLLTSQTTTDLAMLQITLSQNVAISLLDRFNEAKNVLIPAWRQQTINIQTMHTPEQLQQLNDVRSRLINSLSNALQPSRKS